MSTIFDIRDLTVAFDTPDGTVEAVNGINLTLNKGECLGLVGESGSGKSQTFMAAMGLLADNGKASGQIVFDNHDLLSADETALNKIRGDRMAMIFQDPMTSLTPHMKVGQQLTEVLIEHRGASKSDAKKTAVDMFDRVHIPEAAKRFDQYPHELSGGLRQRVMIAMAMICQPEVIIADEPTTALDVTVQAQILDLLIELKDDFNTAIVMITHDLGVIAGIADRVAVMYGGRIVEQGSVRDIFYDPSHPYTAGLLNSMPRLDETGRPELAAIPGQPPNLQNLPPGCAFQPRCPKAVESCVQSRPTLEAFGDNRARACFVEART